MKQMSATEQLQRLKEPIIEKCMGEKTCSKVFPLMKEVNFGDPSTLPHCLVYAFPKAKWRNGDCNMADHIELEAAKKEKIRVGQQKQKKK
jgi:hypothetical protein